MPPAVPDESPREFARYLPLSARPRVDESGVTGQWEGRLTELELAVEALEVPASARASFDQVLAAARRRRKVRIADLGRALVAAYELGGHRLVVDSATSGAVCLDRALTAPLAIRAVIRGRTLRATDAGWSLGSGPALPGTARELTLFLFGRGGVPDQSRD